jgi:alpha-L-fucosidase 2
MYNSLLSVIIVLLLLIPSCTPDEVQIIDNPHDLVFEQLPVTWDEGIPLGNGMLGALIWQKEDKLRFSLDRADLWDLRPMANLHTDKFKFSWVYEQWKRDQYKNVQNQFDKPYDQLPAPTKIPAGALEFDLGPYGNPNSIRLLLNDALCEVKWEDGKSLQTFVHASKPLGWFKFQGFDKDIVPMLMPPPYENTEMETRMDIPIPRKGGVVSSTRSMFPGKLQVMILQVAGVSVHHSRAGMKSLMR